MLETIFKIIHWQFGGGGGAGVVGAGVGGGSPHGFSGGAQPC